ncbi:MAG TPA: hybrid sensor histidine kinase/response regulator [Cyanobacteria bacterium UBA8553]|nr:hybrid sensor histidine kinase/response regulator [Cyanobacteria bacterium UBA8553]
MNDELTSISQGNILVVDDTPANLRLLVGILTEKGYKVRPVPNGELALSAARGFPPDLILLDIMMPEMNGYEVCSELKADERTCDIPVIFISAINDVLDKVKAFSVGGVDYITKPFHVEEVLARVEAHLTICKLQRNLQDKNEELTQTLQQLKSTQNQLIQSEKMAALGQLIAGIAHEINTPLGAIRSSIENIANFLSQNIEQLADFFQKLSKECNPDLLSLLQKPPQQQNIFSVKEKRQFKKSLRSQLDSLGIDNSDILADTLVKLGVYSDIEQFLPLLKDPNGEMILNNAYQFVSLQKSTQIITTATERTAKVVFALKNYARYDSMAEKVETNITDGIETVLTLYHNHLKQGVKVIKNYHDLPLVLCYPDELNQVWTNLIHNALQAMENQGTLIIDVSRQDTKVLVSITDSGRGIPPEVMPRIFEPFFTTKIAGEGSGLGLDIVRKIIEKHQGKIEVDSVPSQTTFNVYLPININEDFSHV